MRTKVALVLAFQLALCVSVAHCADRSPAAEDGATRSTSGPLPLDRLRQLFGGGGSHDESAAAPQPRAATRMASRSRSATARPQMTTRRSGPRTASRTPRPGIFSRPSSQANREPAVDEMESEASTETENESAEPAVAANEEATPAAAARQPVAPTVTLARQSASLTTNETAQPVSAASYDSLIRAAPRPVTPREVATPRSQSHIVRSQIPVETKPVLQAAPQTSLAATTPSRPLPSPSTAITPAAAPATQTVIPSRLLASEAPAASQPFEVGLSPAPTLIPEAPATTEVVPAPAAPAPAAIVNTTPAQPAPQTRVTTIPRNTRPVIVPAAPHAALPAESAPPPQVVVQTPVASQPIVAPQPIVQVAPQPIVQAVPQPIVQAAPQPTSDNIYVQPNGGIATTLPANTGTALSRLPTQRPVAVARLTASMVGPEQIFFGDTGIFKVMLVNDGDAPAVDVRVEVLANETLVKTLNVGTIPAKSDIEVEIALAPNKTGPMELRTSASGSDGVKAVAGTAVFVGKPELSLAIAGPPQMNFGDLKLYTAILNNSGNADATNVSVLVMLQGEKAQTLPVGIVPAGQTRQVRFELRPEQAGQVSVNAVATADGNVQAVANGAIHVMKHEVELAFEGPRQMRFGEKAVYTLLVKNNGNSDAENVVVNVTLGESVLDRLYEGTLHAGKEEKISFEVSPSKPGFHALRAVALGAGNIQAAASAKLQVQHGQLEVKVESPAVKFAGAEATYTVRVKNIGDANAEDVLVTAHLPESVKFLGGVDRIDFYEGITWRVGHMTPGQEEKFELNCELSAPGEQTITINATGADQLEASQSVTTAVEALADVRLFVADPQGLVPVGQDVVYEIEVHNRGVKPAQNIEVVMQLSEALEPIHVEGGEAQLGARGVVFDRIPEIAAKETIKLRVTARAKEKGSHQYRVEMTAEEPNTFMASEGTTRFYGTSSVGEAASASE